MKNYLKTLGLGVVFIALAGFVFLFFGAPYQSQACGGGGAGGCGWGGSQGGSGYVPQQRGSRGWWPGSSSSNGGGAALSEDQARNILARHVAKLNPELKVGPVEDGGSFYKADVFSKTNEVVDRLAVDKQSGRMMPAN